MSHSAALAGETWHWLKRADRLTQLGQCGHDPFVDAHVRTRAFQHVTRG